MGYGRRYLRESELQMAAPLRTDPIEHQVTSSWPTRGANGNVALRGIDRLSSLRPPRWPLTEYTFSWKPHRGLQQDQGACAQGERTHARERDLVKGKLQRTAFDREG